MCGEMRNGYKNWNGKPEGERLLEKRGWVDNI
jgi:hypothetical protein